MQIFLNLWGVFLYMQLEPMYILPTKKKIVIIVSQKKKTLLNEQILLVETKKKKKNYSTQLHLRLFEERIKAYLDWEGREREWRGVE